MKKMGLYIVSNEDCKEQNDKIFKKVQTHQQKKLDQS